MRYLNFKLTAEYVLKEATTFNYVSQIWSTVMHDFIINIDQISSDNVRVYLFVQ
jgi:hypothetical protein